MNYENLIKTLKPANLKRLNGLELIIVELKTSKTNIYIKHNNYILSDVYSKDSDTNYFEIADREENIATFLSDNNYIETLFDDLQKPHPLHCVKSRMFHRLLQFEDTKSVMVYRLFEEKGTYTIQKTFDTRQESDHYVIPMKLDAENPKASAVLDNLNNLYVLELANIEREIVKCIEPYLDSNTDNIFRAGDFLYDNLKTDVNSAFDYIDMFTSEQLDEVKSDTDISFKEKFLDILQGYDKLFIEDNLQNDVVVESKTKQIIKKYTSPEKGALTLVSDNVFRYPFYHSFPENELMGGKVTYKVEVGKDDKGNKIVVPATLTLKQNLTPFQYLIMCGILSIHKRNPDKNVISITDLANEIHRTPSHSRIDKSDKLYSAIIEDSRLLRNSSYIYDTSGQVYYKRSKGNDQFLNVNTRLEGHYIEGRFESVEINGKHVIDAIVLNNHFKDDPLNQYILATNQLYELPSELSVNPLKGGRDTISIFYYLAIKTNNMPFGQRGVYLAKKRIQLNKEIEKRKEAWILEKTELQNKLRELDNEIKVIEPQTKNKSLTFKDVDTERAISDLSRKKTEKNNINTSIKELDKKISGKDKEALKDLKTSLTEEEKKYSVKSRTILVKTMEEELGLKMQRNRLVKYIQNILDYWKSENIIESYKVKKKEIRGGRKTIEAFIIKFI